MAIKVQAHRINETNTIPPLLLIFILCFISALCYIIVGVYQQGYLFTAFLLLVVTAGGIFAFIHISRTR
jgi:hypothetical protein